MTEDKQWMLTALAESEDNEFKGPTRSGEWEPMSGTLGELGDALAGLDHADVDVVRSTPDPWAQVRSFADAVLNPVTRRPKIIDQWRGLLALFALSKEYENTYTLRLTPVALGSSGTRFAEVMRHLLPRNSLPPTDNRDAPGWDTPVIVTLAILDSEHSVEHNVALLNPASLVAAGRDVERLQLSCLPWMRNGLSDPTKLSGPDELSRGDLLIMARYVQHLSQQLVAACAGKGTTAQQEVLNQILMRLHAYHGDCLRKLGGVDDLAFKTHPGDAPAGDLHSLFKLCLVPMVAAAREGSDCIIRLRQDVGGQPFSELVLLDRTLETNTRPATDIGFWGRTTLEQALSASKAQLDALREEIAKAGYLLVTPDDLFTQVLVRMDEKSDPGQIAMHSTGLQNCLLPLSPLTLLIHKPEDLKRCVSIAADGTVILQLSVGQHEHKLARRYVKLPTQAGDRQLLDEVDWVFGDFAVWPDFSSDAWHHYCARIDYATNSFKSVRGRFALSGPLIAAMLRDIPPAQRASQAAKWASGAKLGRADDSMLDPVPPYADRSYKSQTLTRLRASNSAGRASEVQVANKPFEAAFFSIVPDTGDAVPAGMSLLQIKHIAEVHENSGVVAIDFGTTNTVACLNDTSPVRLKARVVHPIHPLVAQPARAAQQAQKFENFLPPNERLLPTPTVVINRMLDADARDLLKLDRPLARHPFVRQMMYFQPDFAENGTISAVPLHEWSVLLLKLKYNLKWSKEPEIREAARAYLQQLMLMIACEWASKGFDPAGLSWHYSRPRDMGDDADFIKTLKAVASEIIPNVAADAIRPMQYEGDAAALYIMDEPSNPDRTKGAINVILDIGGGTTDISIWNNDLQPKKLASASLRLAGGDFFTDHIIQNPEILADFGLSSWADIIGSMHTEPDNSLKENIHYVGELLFSGKTLDEAINREWAFVSGKPTVERLKETAYVFLGGVAWLVGRDLRNRIRDGELPVEALDDIAVAFCGRGSGLFVRLHGPNPKAESDISELLRLVAAAAGEDAEPPQVQVSPFPKIEVAAGMFLSAQQGAMSAAASPDAPRRKKLDLSQSDQQTVAGKRSEDACYTTMALDIGLEDLDHFLKVFAQVSGFTVTISDDQRKKIINGARDIEAKDAANGRPKQSEFATVLKMLVSFLRMRPEQPMRPKTSW